MDGGGGGGARDQRDNAVRTCVTDRCENEATYEFAVLSFLYLYYFFARARRSPASRV